MRWFLTVAFPMLAVLIVLAGCALPDGTHVPSGYPFEREDPLGPDKLGHFGAGVLAAAAAEVLHPDPFYVAGFEIPSGCVASFTLGVGKELWDANVYGSYFEAMDVVWTTFGCAFTWEF